MNLDKIKEQPPIPMLRTPVFRDTEIEGIQVRVHKPKARQSAAIAQKLLESFGETLLRIFVSEDDELEEVFSEEGKAKNAKLFKTLMAGGNIERAFMRLEELGQQAGEDWLFWYFETALSGNVEIDGYRYQSVEEMDQAGFGMSDYLSLIGTALTLGVYPTPGDQPTDGGSPVHSRPAVSQGQQRGTQPGKRRKGGTGKAGQSVQMSARSG